MPQSKIGYEDNFSSYVLQNTPKISVVNALFGKPLRPNNECDVTETHWSESPDQAV